MLVKETPWEVCITILDCGGHSDDWLGVMLAEDGVVSTVTVVSVSSPGEMEVKLMSGGERRSELLEDWMLLLILLLGCLSWSGSLMLVTLGRDSVSGVPSTEMLRRDIESSEDNVLEETAWDPYPLSTKKESNSIITTNAFTVFENHTKMSHNFSSKEMLKILAFLEWFKEM